MAVNCRLHLYFSPWKRLSSPTETSKRLRGAMRWGLWSESCVPGAGMVTRVDPYCEADQDVGSLVNGVARTLPQNSPAWNSWSAVKPLRSTAFTPSPNGTEPATRPLSYRQLNPTHGPFFHGWYCRCVVWLKFSS